MAAHRCVGPFYNPGTPKKWEKNVHNYFIHLYIDPVYGLFNVPKLSTILHLWHTIHWKHPYIMHYKQHQIVVDATNSGVKAILSSFQLFDHVWTMVYINVTYFAMTVYPWYYWHVDRTPSSPGSTPQPPRDDTSLCISITPRPQKMDIIATFWPCLHNGLQ